MSEHKDVNPVSTLPAQWASAKLSFACKRCGAKGLIRIAELNRALVCQSCWTWYRVDRTGLVEIPPPPVTIQVEVRSHLAGYKAHDVVLEDVARRKFRRALADRIARVRERGLPLRWLAIASSVLVAIVCLIALGRETVSAKVPDEPLPDKLEDRAQLLADCWLRQDVHQMLRLVNPTRDRDLRRWMAKNPAPGAARESGLDRSVKIEVAAIDRSKPNLADITVRVNFLQPVDGKSELNVKYRWVLAKNGDWQFWPYVPPSPKQYRYK